MTQEEVVWLTKREAAARARVTERTIERAIAAGELRASGGGGVAVRIRPGEVDRWLESRGRTSRV